MKKKTQSQKGKLLYRNKLPITILGLLILLFTFLTSEGIFGKTKAQEENMPENLDNLLQDFGLISPTKAITESPVETQIEQTIPKITPETIKKTPPEIQKSPNNENQISPEKKEQVTNSNTSNENNTQKTSLLNFFNKLSLKDNTVLEVPLPKDSKPIQVKGTKSLTESEFKLHGFIKDGNKLRGKSSIDLSESKGTLPVSTVLESLDGTISVEIPKNTTFKTEKGEAYEGIIITPKKDTLVEKNPNFKGKVVRKIEAIKVGSTTTPLTLEDSNGQNTNAKVIIPMPQKKIGDVVAMRSSEDGKSRTNLGNFEVKNINERPSVEVLTDHFSWLAQGSGLYGEGLEGGFYYNGPFRAQYSHGCFPTPVVHCDFAILGESVYFASFDDLDCWYDYNGTQTFTGVFAAYSDAGLSSPCGDGDSLTDFRYDNTPPSNPVLTNEPATTNGTSNTVYLGTPSTDAGVQRVEYEYCVSEDFMAINCFNFINTTNTEATFDNLTGRTTYYYFVKAKDGLGNETFRQGGTSSQQIPNPPPAPTCTPNGSSGFCGSIGVSCSSSYPIKYTTDGSDPTCSSSNWSDRSFLDTTTLKVAACDNGTLLSTINSYTYTEEPLPGTINFSPASQTFCAPIDVTLSLNSFYATHTIKYTTNGTDPTCASNQYSSPLPFSIGTTTVKAIACNACNQAGTIGTETYTYNCDVTPPTLSFTDNVSSSRVNSDTITADRGDATTAKWTYDADGICPAAASGNYSYWSTDSMNQNTQANNGNYICLLGIDSVGNADTLASSSSIHIDTTAPSAPTITCTNYPNNSCYASSSNSDCSITTKTRGPSNSSVEYNIGAGWVSIGSSTGFSFFPAEGTTNVQMRVSDVGGGPASSNTYIIKKDSTPPNTPVPDAGSYGTTTPTLTWPIPGGGGCDTSINNYVVVIYSNAGCTNSINGGGPTSNNYTVPGGILSEGNTYYYTVAAIDGVGNTSNTSACTSFSIRAADWNPPSVGSPEIIGGTYNGSCFGGGSITFRGSVSDDVGINSCYYNLGAGLNGASRDSQNPGYCSTTLTPSGNITINFAAADTSSNYGYGSSSSFTRDIAAPDIPTMNAEPTYTQGTTNSISSSTVSDNGCGGSVEYQFCKNTSNSTAGCVGGNLTSRTSFNLAAFNSLIDGQTYYYFVRSRDNLGNQSSRSSSTQSTQDNTAPICSFSDDVEVGPVLNDNIRLNMAGATTIKRKYNATSSCPTNSGVYTMSTINWIESSPINNGSYICIYGSDDAGNYCTKASANPLNINTIINLSFTDPVSSTRVAIDGVDVDRGSSTTKKRTYDADGVCPAALSGNYNYRSSTSMNQNDESHNGEYICLLGIDDVGNFATLSSFPEAIKIDTTTPSSPTLTCSDFFNNTCGNYTGSITCSINNTGGPSPVTTEYNIGSGRINNGSNLSFSFTPNDGTTNIQMRISDIGGSALSNVFVIEKDTTGPTITFNGGSGLEGNAGTRTISNYADTGCAGFNTTPYAFQDGSRGAWTNSITYTINAPGYDGLFNKTIYAKARDNLGNESISYSASRTRTNVAPTTNAITTVMNECQLGILTGDISDPGPGEMLTTNWYNNPSCTGGPSSTGPSRSVFGNDVGVLTYSYITQDDDGGSSSCTGATLIFNDIVLAANSFSTGNIGSSAKSYNRKLGTNASAGSCETITASIETQGTKGTSTILGDIITYTPNSGYNGSDTVVLRITDGDTSITRNITLNGIDTINPSTTINPNGYACTGGNIPVNLTCFDSDSGCSQSEYKIVLAGSSCDESSLNVGNSFNIPGIDGNFSQVKVCYRSIDIAGNQETINTSPIFNIDRIGPDAPLLTNPGSGEEVGFLSPTFNWGNSNEIGCGIISGYYIGIYTDASCSTLNQGSRVTNTSYTVATPLTNGQTYYRKVLPQDSLNNTGIRSECRKFTINSNIFTVNLTKSIGGYFNTGSFTVTGTFSSNTTDFDAGDITISNGLISNFSQISQNVYQREITPTNPAVPTASKTITLSINANVAHDTRGSGNVASNILSVIYDNISPIITVYNPSTNTGTSKTITGSVDYGNLTMSDATTSTTCDASRSFVAYAPVTFSSETDNGKYICYKAIDDAGNISYQLSNMISGIDRTNPIITINNPNTSVASSKTITASTNEGNLTMSDATTSTTCDASRSFIAYTSVTFSSEADNGKYICYRAVDSAGNISYQLSNMISGINTSLPVITINNPNTNPETSKNISASVNTGSLNMSDATTSTTCDASRSFIAYAPITFSSETDNGKYVCYRAIDGIGNTSYLLSSIIGGIDRTAPSITEVSGVTPNPTSDTTPDYSFSSTEGGTITYGGGCSSSTTNAITGNNTITFNVLSNGTYTCTIRVTDTAGNISNILTISPFTIDTDSPIIQQVTPIATPSNNPTPSYTFSSNKSGTIIYGGNCSSSTSSAISGNNTIIFNALAAGTYNNCTIQIRDAVGNMSNILAINQFTIDNIAPTLSTITQIPSIGNNPTPNYTFSSTETGSISYSGSCISAITTAYPGNNTITLNTLADGTYSDCKVRVTDNVGNASNRLQINTFTIDTTPPNLTGTNLLSGTISTTNPNYIFFSSEGGTIAFTGSCPTSTTSALSGTNNISFNLAGTGTYNDCRIRVIDAAGNTSNRLDISAFIVTAADSSPDAFTFARITDAKRGRYYRSNTITITGLSNGNNVQTTLTGGGILYLNNINVGTSALVKNNDIIYIELRASDEYSSGVSSTLTITDKSAIFTVVTEDETNTNCENYDLSEEEKSALQELYRIVSSLDDTLKIKFKDMLEHKIDDLGDECSIGVIKLRYIYDLLVEDINNSKDIVYVAPNGKIYIIIQKLGGYTSANFMPSNRERLYKTLTEIKTFIDRNNPGGSLNYSIDDSRNAATHITPNGKKYAIYKTTTGKYVARGMTIPKLFSSLQELKNHLDANNQKKK